jgi:hypothetical protein
MRRFTLILVGLFMSAGAAAETPGFARASSAPGSTVQATSSASAATSANGASTWKQVAPIPNAALLLRNTAVVAATKGTDGYTYVQNTCTHFSCVPTPMYVYKGVANKWTSAAQYPSQSWNGGGGGNLAWASATGVQGKVYAVGGGSADTTGWYPSDVLYAYTAKTNTWLIEAAMPTSRGQLSAAQANGLIYALGGAYTPNDGSCCGNYQSTSVVEAYNSTTNSWIEEAPMLQADDSFATAVGSDGRIYAIGGEYTNWETGQFYTIESVEAYSPTANTWANVATFPYQGAGPMVGAVTGSDGQIYALSKTNLVALYSVATNAWTQIASPPIGNATGGGPILMSSVQASNGLTDLLVLQRVCNAVSGGVKCSLNTYIYPT